ncbi:hypothetical protein AVEN_47919-1 [Araneus ventricosus]|uniref:Uncharacterized protein n=1 Tax=Araneus ventricosus TaxID=182803 RepID=A0A4Y2UXK2_ARAVE|nr:hypothetical protein AVEN_47919-1 [Araneus ventricosus]
MSRLDESRWKKHGERYAAAITDDRGNASRLRSSMHDREQLLFAARVDIDVYDASGNIAAETSETLTELDILDSVKNKNNTAMNYDEDDVDGNDYVAEINKPSYDEMLKSFETTRR